MEQETLEEVVFIKKDIDFYWSQYNSNHIDNLKDFEVSKKIIEQLKNK
jgi:CMP-N-acetylneuraminic acid synthetase